MPSGHKLWGDSRSGVAPLPHRPRAVQPRAARWAALLCLGLEAWQTCSTRIKTYSMQFPAKQNTTMACGHGARCSLTKAARRQRLRVGRVLSGQRQEVGRLGIARVREHDPHRVCLRDAHRAQLHSTEVFYKSTCHDARGGCFAQGHCQASLWIAEPSLTNRAGVRVEVHGWLPSPAAQHLSLGQES